MRTGLTVSLVAHAGLIALAFFGIAMGKPLVTPPVESIAVDLVPMSEFSNIRMGSLDSKIVETETPSAVEDVKPAELARPTGNTEQDQPKPANNPDPTPAPTEQTAPAPEPADPVIEPEPEPQPQPPQPAAVRPPQPQPEPAPVEEPPAEPVEAEPALATPVETPDPAELAPRPVVKNASLADKRAAYRKQLEAEKQKKAEEAKKAEEEKKRKEAERKKAEEQKRIELAKANEAKLLDEVANIINNEKSRGATTGSGGTPTLGRADGRSATLSKSEIDGLVAQIKQCLNVPAGAAEAGLVAQLEFSIDAAGMVRQPPKVLNAPASALEQALASSAQRAVMRCGPYMVTSQEVRATFDPSQF